jgi:hypothetical protein
MSEGLQQSTRRLTLTFEVLERQHPEQHISLVSLLFGLLDRLITVETETRASLSYSKQIVLSCLTAMVKGLKVFILLICLTVDYLCDGFECLPNRYINYMHSNINKPSSAQ